jgi:enoyl-CoA hydratase/carnithine racemase
MNESPLSTETRGTALYVTLDTPACAVNIFTDKAAWQLVEILGALDPDVRVVVFRSAKAESFVNGASLMLGSAVSQPGDLPRLTATIRRAYDAVENLRVPSVAAIRGNCYGCGVELTLRCRYRVAGDSYDTHVRMTEIADYLLVPTFGSTQYLPRLLGLESATEFLLWGQQWSAREALSRGLFHGCFPDSEFELAVERVVVDLALRGASSLLSPPRARTPIDVEAFGRLTRERIARLPPAYRDVYGACYALMERAALKGTTATADLEAEVLAAGQSILNPASKAAVAFFFIRQLSEQVTLREAAAPKSAIRVDCERSPGPGFLRDELEGRRMRGVTFRDLSDVSDSDALRVVSYGSHSTSATDVRSLAVSDGMELGPLDSTTSAALYAPAWRRGVQFAEIAALRPSGVAQEAFRLLTRAGVKSIVTQPKTGFVSNEVLRAYLAPQIAFLRQGGDPNDLAATLVDFGFTRLAGDWLAGWELEKIAALLAASEPSDSSSALVMTLAAMPTTRLLGGSVRPPLRDAVLVSLLACTRRCLLERTVVHPSVIDVAMRELIDFPLGRTSLCRYLTVARARELLLDVESIRSFVAAQAVDTANEYVERGRDFYR